MFNVGGGELLVILLVALIVVGPAQLPKAARQVGRAMTELRRLSSGFQSELRSALEEAEADTDASTTRTDRRSILTPASETLPVDHAEAVAALRRSVDAVGRQAEPHPATTAPVVAKKAAATRKRAATKAGGTKKTATKRTAAKKTATKRTAAKKTAARKTAARKTATKKAAAKKAAASRHGR